MKDKLVLLFPDGVGIRNYIYSEVFKDMDKELVLFHNFDANTVVDIKKHAPFSEEYTLPKYKESFLEKFLRESICLSRLQHNAKLQNNPTILTNWNPSAKTFPKKVFYFLVTLLSFFIFHYKQIENLERLYQNVIRKSAFYKEISVLLQKIQPQQLFCSHQRAINCAPIFAACSDWNIKTTTVIYSWDNLPKARLALRADCYLVWSEYMFQEMRTYYPEIPKEKILVTGTPQFDFYEEEKLVFLKDEFYNRFDLNPSKKIICFSGDDALTSPDDPSYLEDLAEQIMQHQLDSEYQILFRRCPVDFSGRYDNVIQKYAGLIKVADPLWYFHKEASFASVYPTFEDVKLLVSTAKYADIVVNVGSTMAFDFAMYHKPCIFIHYDQKVPLNSKWSTKTIYQFQHFKSMPSSNAVLWVTQKEDWVKMLQKQSEFSINPAMQEWKNIVLGSQTKVANSIKKILQ